MVSVRQGDGVAGSRDRPELLRVSSNPMHVSRLVTSRRVREGSFPLVLASEVSAKTLVRGATLAGSALVKYKLEKYDVTWAHLTITGERVRVYKGIAAGITTLDANIKATVTALFDKDVEYDTRAFAYCVGRRLALLSTEQDVDLNTCNVFPYSRDEQGARTEEEPG